MEMSASQLALRLISSNGRVNATRLRTGQLEDEDWSRVSSAIRMLKESKIFIDDTPALSPEVLRAKARRLKQIGRASCRESVWQYVEILVAAVSLKKKHSRKYRPMN